MVVEMAATKVLMTVLMMVVLKALMKVATKAVK